MNHPRSTVAKVRAIGFAVPLKGCDCTHDWGGHELVLVRGIWDLGGPAGWFECPDCLCRGTWGSQALSRCAFGVALRGPGDTHCEQETSAALISDEGIIELCGDHLELVDALLVDDDPDEVL